MDFPRSLVPYGRLGRHTAQTVIRHQSSTHVVAKRVRPAQLATGPYPLAYFPQTLRRPNDKCQVFFSTCFLLVSSSRASSHRHTLIGRKKKRWRQSK